jgi:hypothetical protein
MTIKLHRCRATFAKSSGYPCWKVQQALDEAGPTTRSSSSHFASRSEAISSSAAGSGCCLQSSSRTARSCAKSPTNWRPGFEPGCCRRRHDQPRWSVDQADVELHGPSGDVRPARVVFAADSTRGHHDAHRVRSASQDHHLGQHEDGIVACLFLPYQGRREYPTVARATATNPSGCGLTARVGSSRHTTRRASGKINQAQQPTRGGATSSVHGGAIASGDT